MSSPSSSRALAPYSEWLDPRFRQLLLFQMAFGYAYAALILVPKFATVQLGAGPRELGLLAACPTIAAVLCAPLCGLWLDRGGYRGAMLSGAAVLTLSIVPLGYVHTLGPFVHALRILHGIGNALMVGGSAAYVTRLVPAGHHGRAFGTAGAASLMMNAVASSATEHLADAFGWGFAYQIAAVICALAFASALMQPAGLPLLVSARKVTFAPNSGRRRAGAYAMFTAGAGFGMLVTFTQPYALALGAKHVASLFVGYTLTALAVRLGLGGAVDRWGRQRAASVALAIYACTVLFASVLRPEALFALGCAFGVAHGLAWPALIALAVETAAADRVGSALAQSQALFAAGSMLAVWLGGVLIEARGYPFAFVTMGFGVASGALVLARRTSAREAG